MDQETPQWKPKPLSERLPEMRRVAESVAGKKTRELESGQALEFTRTFSPSTMELLDRIDELEKPTKTSALGEPSC